MDRVAEITLVTENVRVSRLVKLAPTEVAVRIPYLLNL